MSDRVSPLLAELTRYFRALYGERLAKLVLYGSQARGDARPDSDIDVLVVLHGPVNPGEEIARVIEFTAALSLEHDTVVACVFVSAERYEHEQSPFLMNIRREGVPL